MDKKIVENFKLDFDLHIKNISAVPTKNIWIYSNLFLLKAKEYVLNVYGE